jgi:hypothetical protein
MHPMTLLIPLLLRLTTLFERGKPNEEPAAETHFFTEEAPANSLEKE